MYRAVGLKAIEAAVDPKDAAAVIALVEQARIEFREGPAGMRVLLDGRDVTERIRAADVTDAASVVSIIPRVRELMVAQQRAMGAGPRGVVMEGRDIGTVVFPQADVKVYLDAAAEVRSARRFADGETPSQISESVVREQLAERDRRDRTRAASPLMAADNAVQIDSSQLSASQVLEQVWALVESVAARK
jgi:cytidylate kinase